jgi:hypothetical protein
MASAGKAARYLCFSSISRFVVGANFQRPSAKSRSQERYSSSESQHSKAEATHSFLSKHRKLTPSILPALRQQDMLCSLFFSLRPFYLTDGKKNFVARRSTTKRKSKHQRRPYTNLYRRAFFFRLVCPAHKPPLLQSVGKVFRASERTLLLASVGVIHARGIAG